MSSVDDAPPNYTTIIDKIRDVDPIDSPTAQRLRKMLWDVYTQVEFKALHVSSSYIEITVDSAANEVVTMEAFPAALITSYLVNRSCTQVTGSPGTGKTSLIRAIDRMMTGSSIPAMENIIHCEDEITREDWLGTKDPQRIIKGTGDWQIKWSKWIRNKNRSVSIIFDEANRAPYSFQNQVLLLLADSRVQYGTEFTETIPEFRAFMTINPLDELAGSLSVRPLQNAMLDRIMQSVRVAQPRKRATDRFSKCRQDERQLGYNDDDQIKVIFTDINDLRTATLLAEKIPITPEAHNLATYLATEASLCIRSPLYDKTLLTEIKPGAELCTGCHFDTNKNVCRKVYGGSMRMFKDLIALGRAYAFFIGEPTLTPHIIHAIAPDTISHRMFIVQGELRKDIGNTYGDARKFINDYYVEWCWEKLAERADTEAAVDRLIHGTSPDPDKDFYAVIQFANNDLYSRLDDLPIISIGDGINDNLSKYVPIYSCKDLSYITEMRRVMDAAKRKDTASLHRVLASISDIPLKKLVQEEILTELHHIDTEKEVEKHLIATSNSPARFKRNETPVKSRSLTE